MCGQAPRCLATRSGLVVFGVERGFSTGLAAALWRGFGWRCGGIVRDRLPPSLESLCEHRPSSFVAVVAHGVHLPRLAPGSRARDNDARTGVSSCKPPVWIPSTRETVHVRQLDRGAANGLALACGKVLLVHETAEEVDFAGGDSFDTETRRPHFPAAAPRSGGRSKCVAV